MERVVFNCNYISDRIKEDVAKALKDGKAVHIGTSCIGHTRAAMIAYEAEKLYKELGAHKIDDSNYWML